MVGDLARACDLSEQGIRYLESVGRCEAFARTPSGVRLFTPETVERLKRERKTRRATRAYPVGR